MNTDMNTFWAQLQTAVQTWALPVAGAVVILVVAHFVAKAVKWAIAKGVDRIPFFARRETLAVGQTRPPSKIGERIGEVGYWVVWLLGLIAALNALDPQGQYAPRITDPLNQMVGQFLSYVPNVVGAALIFFIGFALATIVRRMVEAVVQAAELDRRLVAAGVTHTPHGPGLARLLGILVFTLIIIPVAIAALDTLAIPSISEPAKAMLNRILSAIPGVLGAGLIIFMAYLIGRWVATLTEEGLRSIGFDEMIQQIATAEPIRMGLQHSDPTPHDESIRIDSVGFPPSRIVSYVVLVGIMLFATIEAANQLGFTVMAGMLNGVLAQATTVLVGAIIIAIGVVVANILAAAVSRRDTATSEIVSILIRWGVIILAAAMGLSFMGLANEIIVLAFGLLLGSVSVAVAIAFGVGGRDAAKRMLARWMGEN